MRNFKHIDLFSEGLNSGSSYFKLFQVTLTFQDTSELNINDNSLKYSLVKKSIYYLKLHEKEIFLLSKYHFAVRCGFVNIN